MCCVASRQANMLIDVLYITASPVDKRSGGSRGVKLARGSRPWPPIRSGRSRHRASHAIVGRHSLIYCWPSPPNSLGSLAVPTKFARHRHSRRVEGRFPLGARSGVRPRRRPSRPVPVRVRAPGRPRPHTPRPVRVCPTGVGRPVPVRGSVRTPTSTGLRPHTRLWTPGALGHERMMVALSERKTDPGAWACTT